MTLDCRQRGEGGKFSTVGSMDSRRVETQAPDDRAGGVSKLVGLNDVTGDGVNAVLLDDEAFEVHCYQGHLKASVHEVPTPMKAIRKLMDALCMVGFCMTLTEGYVAVHSSIGESPATRA